MKSVYSFERYEPGEEPEGIKLYSFWVRPDFKFQIILPEDLTLREAERLAAFIRTLSYETTKDQ